MRFYCTSSGPIGGLNCEVLLYFKWCHSELPHYNHLFGIVCIADMMQPYMCYTTINSLPYTCTYVWWGSVHEKSNLGLKSSVSMLLSHDCMHSDMLPGYLQSTSTLISTHSQSVHIILLVSTHSYS